MTVDCAAAESGVNAMADKKFPQETGVSYGRDSVPTGSNSKPIPEEEGGVRDDRGRYVPHIRLGIVGC